MVRRELVSDMGPERVQTKGTLCPSLEHLAGAGVIMCSQILSLPEPELQGADKVTLLIFVTPLISVSGLEWERVHKCPLMNA